MPMWGAFFRDESKSFDVRVERLIALARVALAGFALLAIYLDPSEPTQYAQSTFGILLGYLVLSAIVAAAVLSAHMRAAWHFPLHLADIAIVSLLMYLSEGPASPFFIFYTFIMLAGTLRWDWRGALWTAGALVVLLVALTVTSDALDAPEAESELNRIIIRSTFLLVAGGMLASYGVARERSRDLLMRLSAWPSPSRNPIGTDYGRDLGPALLHIATTAETPRILVLWQQATEPGLNALLWSNEECRMAGQFDNAVEDWVAPELRDAAFLADSVTGNVCVTVDGVRRCRGAVGDIRLADEFQMQSVITAPFGGAVCRGRIFLLNQRGWREDDLTIADVAAARIGIELEHYTLRLQLEETSAIRERARLARDLHDGLLQSLTAAGLQLRAAAKRADPDSRELLENLRELLAEEQRRVRTFVRTRPATGSYLMPDVALSSLTAQLCTKLELLWGCAVNVKLIPEHATIPRRLAPQLDFMLAESIANAVQHGRAPRVDVTIETTPEALSLHIRDYGDGFTDQMDGQRELTALAHGPVSLRNRVTELGGGVAVTTSPGGTTLKIRLPLLD